MATHARKFKYHVNPYVYAVYLEISRQKTKRNNVGFVLKCEKKTKKPNGKLPFSLQFCRFVLPCIVVETKSYTWIVQAWTSSGCRLHTCLFIILTKDDANKKQNENLKHCWENVFLIVRLQHKQHSVATN